MNASRKLEQDIKTKARAYLAARGELTGGAAERADVPPEIPADVRAWEEACDQVRRAKEVLDFPAEAYLHYPFAQLGDMIGGVRPGRVHYYVSASNNGKTTFVRSFIEAAITAGQSCAVMTTETTTDDFRLSLAAAALGIPVGDIATGAYLHRPDVELVKRRIGLELDRWTDYESGAHTQLQIAAAVGYLTAEKVRQAARTAADSGANWFLIDHVDHVEGTQGMSEYQVSNAVNTAAWRAALDLDLRVLCTSQLNQDVFRQNPLGMCVTPQESWVKYGGLKKERGWVMIGASRHLRTFAGEDERKAELAAYRDGKRTLADITLPCAHLRVMKHRDYGDRVGASCLLEVQHGRLIAPTIDTLGDIHGIRTARAL